METDFPLATEKTLSVDNTGRDFRYLHFRFSFEPVLSSGRLTEVIYSISYNEVGTDLARTWVRKYDGHVVNLPGSGVDHQWKGPFGGLNGIRYKFYLAIQDEPSGRDDLSVIVRTYSTDPESDARYCDAYYRPPFSVTASYTDSTIFRQSLEVYSYISTIVTVVGIGAMVVEGAPAAAIAVAVAKGVAQTVVETIVINATTSYLDRLPVYVTMKCNLCGAEHTVERHDFSDFEYHCVNSSCPNSAVITFPD